MSSPSEIALQWIHHYAEISTASLTRRAPERYPGRAACLFHPDSRDPIPQPPQDPAKTPGIGPIEHAFSDMHLSFHTQIIQGVVLAIHKRVASALPACTRASPHLHQHPPVISLRYGKYELLEELCTFYIHKNVPSALRAGQKCGRENYVLFFHSRSLAAALVSKKT